MKARNQSSSISEAVARLRADSGVNVFAVCSISMATLIAALCLAVFINVRSAVNTLGDRFVLSVYLEDGLSGSDADALLRQIKKIPGVKSAVHLSREEALSLFRRQMKEQEALLAGLDDNPLPDSFELAIDLQYLGPEKFPALVERISTYPGVEDLSYGKQGAALLGGLVRVLDSEGAAVAVITGAGMMGVIFITVLLALLSGKEPLSPDVPGAGRGFIRTVFLIEGTALAVLGATLALAVLAVMFHSLPQEAPAMLIRPGGPDLLPLTAMGYVLAGSGLAGLVGGLVAAHRRMRQAPGPNTQRTEE